MSDQHRGPHGPASPSRPVTSKGFQPLLNVIRGAHPPYGLMAAALLFSLVTTAAGLVIPLFTKKLVDGFSIQSLDPSTVVLIVGAFLLQAVGGALASYALYYSGLKVVASVRSRLWAQYLRLPVAVFDAKPAGDLASRMTNDTAVLQSLVGDQFPGFVTGLLSSVVGVGFLFWLDWQMSLVMLAAIPIVVAIMVPLGRIRWKTALEILAPLAEAGNVDALGNLGNMYLKGKGVPADATMAVTLFAEGARQGHAESMLWRSASPTDSAKPKTSAATA